MLKNTMFFKQTFILIVQEHHGTVILFDTCFHVDTASLIINNKISLSSVIQLNICIAYYHSRKTHMHQKGYY